MAVPFSARCPSCDARLKIQNPAAVGKKVRCPNCQNPFTVKPPRSSAPQDEFEPDDDFDDYEDYGGSRDDFDDYDDFEERRPLKRGSRRRRDEPLRSRRERHAVPAADEAEKNPARNPSPKAAPTSP